GHRGAAHRRRAGAGRRGGLERRRRGPLRRPAAPRPAGAPGPRRAGAGDPVVLRLRAAARAARAHPRPGAPHRAVRSRLRRRVRRPVRARRPAPAGGRPDGLRQRPGRSRHPARRRQRVVVRAGQRPAARAGQRGRLGRPGARRPVRRPGAPGAGRPRARRPRPGALAGGPHPGRPRPGHPQRGRVDLRDLEQRRPRGLPAPGQRLTGAGTVPGRRLGAPRRRAAAGPAVGRDRRRPGRPGL
ncbi:MAG: Phytoene dehydrogenase, partial [uncultured Pseudonocardia sp.]